MRVSLGMILTVLLVPTLLSAQNCEDYLHWVGSVDTPDVASGTEIGSVNTKQESSPENVLPICGKGICRNSGNCRRCKNAFLIDFMIASSSESCGEGGWFGGEIGFLRNVGQGKGIGAKFFVGGDDCGERVGVRLVGRRWLSPALSFEFAPGMALGGKDNQKYPAASIQLALDLVGYIGVVYSFEQIRPAVSKGFISAPGKDMSTRWESFFGVRTSSWAVPVALALIAVSFGASGGISGD